MAKKAAEKKPADGKKAGDKKGKGGGASEDAGEKSAKVNLMSFTYHCALEPLDFKLLGATAESKEIGCS